ncbi:hypothetical protein TanjilG_18625 [Lupinus angustifolius]|uniref:Uncharacterized protein n=1 Tax=Lupinus angustifolius TaxID=3871 RepID=A0A1J7IVY3_LUPAN|nr:hypothetical protein TanjilG_18625 [Lupinus angustifolius]
MVPPDPLRRARTENVTAKIDRDQGSKFIPQHTSDEQAHPLRGATQPLRPHLTPCPSLAKRVSQATNTPRCAHISRGFGYVQDDAHIFRNDQPAPGHVRPRFDMEDDSVRLPTLPWTSEPACLGKLDGALGGIVRPNKRVNGPCFLKGQAYTSRGLSSGRTRPHLDFNRANSPTTHLGLIGLVPLRAVDLPLRASPNTTYFRAQRDTLESSASRTEAHNYPTSTV